MVPLVLFSFILLVIYFHSRNSNRYSALKKRLPPSPLRLPVIGSFYAVGDFPHRSFQTLSKRYGEVMLLHFGSAPVVVASSAEAAREIMKRQDLIFASRPKLSIARRLFYSGRDVAFASYGEHWRQARSMCVLQLLSNKRVQSFRRIREEETSLVVEKIRRSSSSAVNLRELFSELTNGITCRATLGRKYGGGDGTNEFGVILDEINELLGAFNVGDYVPWLGWINRVNGLDARVEKCAKKVDEFMEGVLREYREKKLSDDNDYGDDEITNIVDTLLEYQRESKDSAPIEDDTIKGLILDIFSAGTDTTQAILEWTMAELIRSPRAMKLLQKEVREVGRNKGGITEDELEKMPYLKAVSKEALRLHPPFPCLLPRESTQDTNLLGYDVPRGTLVLVNNWAISRDPSLWENPEEFRPERFLDTSINYKGMHFEMFPFGAGRRGCPGILFAMSAYELTLSKLINEFDFGLPNGASGEDLDMAECPALVAHKKSPLIVIATSRVSYN